MQQRRSTDRIVRFGSFEVDLEEGRLTRAGLRIRLQGQPFQILTLLLERAGQVVTREEIRQKLWSQETFVEFDDALNTAVRKLRAALGDTADNPRFLETVPRRGYRFVAPVSLPTRPPVSQISQATQIAPSSQVSQVAQDTIHLISPRMPEPFEIPLSESEMALRMASRRPTAPLKTGWQRLAGAIPLAILFAFLLATGAGIYWHLHRPGFQITTKDTIVAADFVNTTGEAVFDDALRQGLEIGLEQTPYVQVLPDRKTSVILKQMGHSPDERITGKTAIEVCQRASGKVTVQGSIASLGTAYLIGLAAIRCDSGEPVANEQVQARRKEDVIDALGQATAQLRSRLGESLPSIQKYNAPLEQATTSSLDALNAYGLALSTWDRRGDRDSLPIFKKAVELDPNFAQAYGSLATIYHNLGESDLARENASKAYELRAQVTEAERTTIEARYYSYVTGELEKAAEVRTLDVQNYPDSAGAYNHLGDVDGALGRYEQSAQNLRKAILLDPTRANTYANLAAVMLALNRVDEASSVLAEAGKRTFQTDLLMQMNYWISFLRGDGEQMKRLVQQSSNEPGVQALLLSGQSNTEAYSGRFEKADELSRQAANLLEHDGDNQSAAACLAQAAVREAEIGNAVRSRELIAQAQRLSRGQDVITLTALSMAQLGSTRRAEVLSQQLNKEWPQGTYVQKYWLPLIRAEIDLRNGQSSQALQDLAVATPPLEFSSPQAMPVATLYPAYLRGQAYLAMGNGPAAVTEFLKLSDRRNLMVNYPLGPLARVGLARAYARAGELQKARKAYLEFFDLWKDADRNLPILKQSQAEFAKLQ